MSFGNADWVVSNAETFDLLEFVFCEDREHHRRSAVDFTSYVVDFLLHRSVVVVKELERLRRIVLHGVDKKSGELFATGPTFSEHMVFGKSNAFLSAVLGHHCNFLVGVRLETVESYDDALPEELHVFDVLVEVAETFT